eukprot:756711-Hanusia_phi.AAC.2
MVAVDVPVNAEMRTKMEKMLREAQAYICKSIEDCDGQGKFIEDPWAREDGGGGLTRVMSGGKVWEKAGVNLAVVHGTMPFEALNVRRGGGGGVDGERRAAEEGVGEEAGIGS